jgi:16S rRNA (uracil1498-N3)-methyltransferase
MKQSLKYFLPQINEPSAFNQFIKDTKKEQAFICFGDAPTSQNLHLFETSNKHNIFLIGPEGDFTEKEITTACDCNYKALNLGNSRLRTETAATHVVSIVNFKKSN